MEQLVDVVSVIAFFAVVAGVAALFFFNRRLDVVRRRLTTGLQIGASDQAVRRGEEVEALVTISRPRGLGKVEVGLVCTEYYDYESTSTDRNGTRQTSRETAEETAHEAWQSVESAVGEQSLRFSVPLEAPFSYRGECLSFKWELVAVGRRHRRLDAQARTELSVLP